ncbi:unnamed protein product [Ectocarpus sp. 8 AP-2014]
MCRYSAACWWLRRLFPLVIFIGYRKKYMVLKNNGAVRRIRRGFFDGTSGCSAFFARGCV